jgi:glycerate 2-kinase
MSCGCEATSGAAQPGFALGAFAPASRLATTQPGPTQRTSHSAGWVAHTATAIVETAAASGLALVAERDRDAWAASSYGTGELIADAARRGARAILLAAGGSATTDGGAGALAALAARTKEAAAARGDARLIVLCDVRTPFEQAAATFAAQKGADADTTAALAARLDALAARLPRDPRGVPLTGCAGGLSGGLWAALGAQLVPGAAWVLDALAVDERLRCARAVITGEGRLDAQTAEGKLVAELAHRARRVARAGAAGLPVHALGPRRPRARRRPCARPRLRHRGRHARRA